MNQTQTPTTSRSEARERFDLEATYAALPPPSASPGPGSVSRLGFSGSPRTVSRYVADIPDDLLREFARETLGAQRCSAEYLDALRVVLGNQAWAERGGLRLEQNRRVDFATERTMRTVIGQMQAAGVTQGWMVRLGEGKGQTVQLFRGRRDMALSLEELERLEEPEPAFGEAIPESITDADVPY